MTGNRPTSPGVSVREAPAERGLQFNMDPTDLQMESAKRLLFYTPSPMFPLRESPTPVHFNTLGHSLHFSHQQEDHLSMDNSFGHPLFFGGFQV